MIADLWPKKINLESLRVSFLGVIWWVDPDDGCDERRRILLVLNLPRRNVEREINGDDRLLDVPTFRNALCILELVLDRHSCDSQHIADVLLLSVSQGEMRRQESKQERLWSSDQGDMIDGWAGLKLLGYFDLQNFFLLGIPGTSFNASQK